MATILEYEIEIAVTDKANKTTLITVSEFAYSLTDALGQASVRLTYEHGSNIRHDGIQCVRIGPPKAFIEAAAAEARASVEAMMKKVTAINKTFGD